MTSLVCSFSNLETECHIVFPGSDHCTVQNNEQTQVDFGYDHTLSQKRKLYWGG